jgi:hypothetical protein
MMVMQTALVLLAVEIERLDNLKKTYCAEINAILLKTTVRK